MNPSVHSLVLSAVDWDELCPWLLFRRCLGLAFSFRFLFLTTIHLLIGSLWLAAAFGWFTDFRTVNDFLECCSFVSAKSHFNVSAPDSESIHALLAEDALPSAKPTPFAEMMGTVSTQSSAGSNLLAETPGLAGSADFAASEPFLKKNSPRVPLVLRDCNRVISVLYVLGATSLLWLLVTRISAKRLTRQLRGPFLPEFRFAISRFPAVLGALLLMAAGAAVLGLPLWVCRFLPTSILPWLTPFALIYATFYFFFLLGVGLGAFFVPCVLMTENSDAFDALSRSCAYALQKPLNFAFYVLAALFFGGIGLLAISVFTGGITWLFVTLAHAPLIPESGTVLILTAFTWGISAFLFLYAVSAVQGLYFLLRRDVDAVELEVVWLPDPQGVPAPKLPKLQSDSPASVSE